MEIENGSGELAESAVNPELERLLVENSKLKYQITHLKRVRNVTVQFSKVVFSSMLISFC